MPAAAFLFANGLILFLGERLRRRAAPVTAAAPAVGVGARGEGETLMRGVDLDEGLDDEQADLRSDARIAGLSLKRGVLIGSAQILAGSITSFTAAYLSVRFLEEYFRTRRPSRWPLTVWWHGPVSFTILAHRRTAPGGPISPAASTNS